MMNMQTLTVQVKVRVRAYGRTHKILIYKNINAEFMVVFSSRKQVGKGNIIGHMDFKICSIFLKSNVKQN